MRSVIVGIEFFPEKNIAQSVADARCGIRGAKTMEMLICMKI